MQSEQVPFTLEQGAIALEVDGKDIRDLERVGITYSLPQYLEDTTKDCTHMFRADIIFKFDDKPLRILLPVFVSKHNEMEGKKLPNWKGKKRGWGL